MQYVHSWERNRARAVAWRVIHLRGRKKHPTDTILIAQNKFGTYFLLVQSEPLQAFLLTEKRSSTNDPPPWSKHLSWSNIRHCFQMRKQTDSRGVLLCLLVLLGHIFFFCSLLCFHVKRQESFASFKAPLQSKSGSSAVLRSQRLNPICSLSSMRSHWAARGKVCLRSRQLDGCWSVRVGWSLSTAAAVAPAGRPGRGRTALRHPGSVWPSSPAQIRLREDTDRNRRAWGESGCCRGSVSGRRAPGWGARRSQAQTWGGFWTYNG